MRVGFETGVSDEDADLALGSKYGLRGFAECAGERETLLAFRSVSADALCDEDDRRREITGCLGPASTIAENTLIGGRRAETKKRLRRRHEDRARGGLKRARERVGLIAPDRRSVPNLNEQHASAFRLVGRLHVRRQRGCAGGAEEADAPVAFDAEAEEGRAAVVRAHEVDERLPEEGRVYL